MRIAGVGRRIECLQPGYGGAEDCDASVQERVDGGSSIVQGLRGAEIVVQFCGGIVAARAHLGDEPSGAAVSRQARADVVAGQRDGAAVVVEASVPSLVHRKSANFKNGPNVG